MDPLLLFFKAQLDRILALKRSVPHAQGPKKPSLSQQDLGIKK